MSERKRGKPLTAAAEYLLEVLNLDPASKPTEAQKRLRLELRGLLSFGSLEERLMEVAHTLNEWSRQGNYKPQWQPRTLTKENRKYLELGQGVYKTGQKSITFQPWKMIRPGEKNSAFYSLAYLLETGRLDRLIECPECKRFLYAQDKRIERHTECQTAHDRRQAAKRMKRRRGKDLKKLKEYALNLLAKHSADSSTFQTIRQASGELWVIFDQMSLSVANGVPKEKVWSRASSRKIGLFRKLREAGIK